MEDEDAFTSFKDLETNNESHLDDHYETNELYKDFDKMVQIRVNSCMKQVTTMMLKKFDQFMNLKLSRMKQDCDNYKKHMDGKLENIEMKLVRKLYEHRK